MTFQMNWIFWREIQFGFEVREFIFIRDKLIKQLYENIAKPITPPLGSYF